MSYVSYDLYYCSGCLPIFLLTIRLTSRSPTVHKIYDINDDCTHRMGVLVLEDVNSESLQRHSVCIIKCISRIIYVELCNLYMYITAVLTQICLYPQSHKTKYSLHTVEIIIQRLDNTVNITECIRVLPPMKYHIMRISKSTTLICIDRHTLKMKSLYACNADGNLQRPGTYGVPPIMPQSHSIMLPGNLPMTIEMWIYAVLVRAVLVALEGLGINSVWRFLNNLINIFKNIASCHDLSQVCMRQSRIRCVPCLCLDWANVLFEVPISRLSTGHILIFRTPRTSPTNSMDTRTVSYISVNVSHNTQKQKLYSCNVDHRWSLLSVQSNTNNTELYPHYGVHHLTYHRLTLTHLLNIDGVVLGACGNDIFLHYFVVFMYMTMLYPLNPLHE